MFLNLCRLELIAVLFAKYPSKHISFNQSHFSKKYIFSRYNGITIWKPYLYTIIVDAKVYKTLRLKFCQMFMDMAVLVEAQGDMIDDIEAQVRVIF